MRRVTCLLIFLSCFLLFSCSQRQGDDTPVSVQAAKSANNTNGSESLPVSLEDRFAYVFGYQMTAALDETFDNLDTTYISQGSDDYNSSTPAFSDEEMADILRQFQTFVYQQAEDIFNQTADSNLEEAESYLSANSRRSDVISLADGKVQYEVLRQGDDGGKHPVSDSIVTVNYSLVTLNSSASGADTHQNAQILLSGTIPGFREVVCNMREGERVRAWIHPDFAYGAYGKGNIGPNQLLIFDIELVSVNN